MSYLNKYNMPAHWRSIMPQRDPHANRNRRSYVKTMVPGKPGAISIPLWIMAKRMLGEKSNAHRVAQLVKKFKLNDRVVSERAAVCIGDTLQIEGKPYLVVIYRQGRRLNYRLDPVNPRQRMIIGIDQHKGLTRLNMLNGERKIHQGTVLAPGTIWTPEGLVSPVVARYLIKLTGKQKFHAYTITQVRAYQDHTQLVVTAADIVESIRLDWDVLGRRRYILLA